MADAVGTRTAALTGQTNAPDVVHSPGTWSVKVDATSGNFTLTVGGVATAGLVATSTAAQVATALNALDAVAGATVTGGPGNAGGTTPYVVTIPDIEGTTALTLTGQNVSLAGGAATITVTTVTAPQVQARHDTTVITDKTDPLAVQTPVAQQTDGLASQTANSPKTTFGW